MWGALASSSRLALSDELMGRDRINWSSEYEHKAQDLPAYIWSRVTCATAARVHDPGRTCCTQPEWPSNHARQGVTHPQRHQATPRYRDQKSSLHHWGGHAWMTWFRYWSRPPSSFLCWQVLSSCGDFPQPSLPGGKTRWLQELRQLHRSGLHHREEESEPDRRVYQARHIQNRT